MALLAPFLQEDNCFSIPSFDPEMTICSGLLGVASTTVSFNDEHISSTVLSSRPIIAAIVEVFFTSFLHDRLLDTSSSPFSNDRALLATVAENSLRMTCSHFRFGSFPSAATRMTECRKTAGWVTVCLILHHCL